VSQVNQKIAELEKAIETGRVMTQQQLEAAEAAEKEYEDQKRKIDAANRDLGSKSPANRIRGINTIVNVAGASAVPALTSLMQADPNYDVRIAACRALGALGGAARPAMPNIDGMLRQPPYEPPIDATQEQLDAQMRDGDYRACLRDAKAKIGR
jgi:hypothetical protein